MSARGYVNKVNILLLSVLIFLQQVFPCGAYASPLNLRDTRQAAARDQAEFYNSNPDQRLESRVNFVGGVKQAGIYHLPDNTNLMEAISLAGGTVDDADLSKVLVKREGPKGFTTYQYDLTKVMSEDNTQFPVVKDRDTILIEVDNSSQRSVTRLTILSLIASIIATGFVIHQSSK